MLLYCTLLYRRRHYMIVPPASHPLFFPFLSSLLSLSSFVLVIWYCIISSECLILPFLFSSLLPLLFCPLVLLVIVSNRIFPTCFFFFTRAEKPLSRNIWMCRPRILVRPNPCPPLQQPPQPQPSTLAPVLVVVTFNGGLGALLLSTPMKHRRAWGAINQKVQSPQLRV